MCVCGCGSHLPPLPTVLVTRALIDTGGSAITNLANLDIVERLTNLANLDILDQLTNLANLDIVDELTNLAMLGIINQHSRLAICFYAQESY